MTDLRLEQIRQLKQKIARNDAQIGNLRNAVARKNQAQASLERFRKNVVSTRDSLQTVTQNQKRILTPVKAMKNENRCAKQYGEGMSNTLSGFGSKVAIAALYGLLMKIDLKAAAYRSSVSDSNNRINQLKWQSEQYRITIRQLEQQMKGDANRV